MPSAVYVAGATLMDLTHQNLLVRPNVRAKRATTAGRQARAGENVPRTARPGPGGLPLALRLSEGLGISGDRVFNEFSHPLIEALARGLSNNHSATMHFRRDS